jgi:hypothetical protein
MSLYILDGIETATIKSVSNIRTDTVLSKCFCVFARRRYFRVRNERFGTTCLSHLQGLKVIQKEAKLPRDPEDGTHK